MDAVQERGRGARAAPGVTALKTLWLLRHAKSSWEEPGLKDFDRPLNKRGQKACQIMAELVARRAIRPDLILCSPALRTRDTHARIAEAAGLDRPACYDPRLYGADAAQLLRCLQGVEGEPSSILLIGHNPAIQELTLLLARRGRTSDLDRVERKYPTAALAELRLGVARWAELAPGEAALAAFNEPKEIKRRLKSAKKGAA